MGYQYICNFDTNFSYLGSNMFFHAINVCQVTREILKTKGVARGFEISR